MRSRSHNNDLMQNKMSRSLWHADPDPAGDLACVNTKKKKGRMGKTRRASEEGDASRK